MGRGGIVQRSYYQLEGILGNRRNGGRVKRARRANLMRIDPHCWYCGKFLVFVEMNGEALPDDFPTIEHLFSRRHGRPQINHTNDTRRVLACPACNHDKGVWGDLLTLAGL